MRKAKVLWYSDTPTCASGFGRVASNLLNVIQSTGEFDITVLGINQYDYYDQSKYPYRIYQAMVPSLATGQIDPFGRSKFLEFARQEEYDIVFTIQDSFVVQTFARELAAIRDEVTRPFRWICYFPIDSTPKPGWLLDGVLRADFPVCYTAWGKSQCTLVCARVGRSEAVAPITVIYHGNNPREFHHIDDRRAVDDFRARYFMGLADNRFLITNVNRNQPRKDLARTLAAFSLFHERHPDSFLYLHTQAEDVGGNLLEYATNFSNLGFMKNWGIPEAGFRALNGVPTQALNQIYNASDVIVSTSTGEGWGLSYTEAMATGTPVIAPRNTSSPEIVGASEERGLLYESGSGPSAFVTFPGDNERLRPLADVTGLIDKLELVYRHPELLQHKTDAARAWVGQHTWDGPNIGHRWIQLFQKAAEGATQHARPRPVATPTVQP